MIDATKYIFIVLSVIAVTACANENHICISSIQESYDYVTTLEINDGSINNLDSRHTIIKTLGKFEKELSRCDMTISHESEVDILSQFQGYQSNMSSLVRIIDVKDNNITYMSIVRNLAGDLKRFPVKQALKKHYQFYKN